MHLCMYKPLVLCNHQPTMQSFLPKVAIPRATYLSNPSRTRERMFCTALASSPSDKFDVQLYMAEKRSAVKKAMEEAIPIKEPKVLHESMRYSSLSGTMIAPLMCIAACELVGGSQHQVMAAACAVQMAWSMGVIHDDLPCIDNDDIRSGNPTNHKVYGESMALLAGVALAGLAFEHLAVATKDVTPDRVLRAISELGKAIGPEMQAGQGVDVLSRGGGSLEQLEFINLHKSGSAAIACMVIGGIIGGATNEEVEILRLLGRKIGLMVQLVDDLSDIDDDSINNLVSDPRLIVTDKTKEMAWKLYKEALQCLAAFDQDKAAPLIAFIDQMSPSPVKER